MSEPQKSDVDAFISSLWESLQRVGEQFGHQYICSSIAGGYLILLQLADQLTDDSKKAIRGYIQARAIGAGWTLPGVVFATRYVKFRLINPSSRTR